MYIYIHVYDNLCLPLIDDTKDNVATPEYAHSGILETINLSWGAFFVQVIFSTLIHVCCSLHNLV